MLDASPVLSGPHAGGHKDCTAEGPVAAQERARRFRTAVDWLVEVPSLHNRSVPFHVHCTSCALLLRRCGFVRQNWTMSRPDMPLASGRETGSQ